MAPMTDASALSKRIDALEMRLTFQDETIETLNQTITEQWKQIDALTRQLHCTERAAAGGREQRGRPHQRTAAALLRAQKKNGLHARGRSSKFNADDQRSCSIMTLRSRS